MIQKFSVILLMLFFSLNTIISQVTIIINPASYTQLTKTQRVGVNIEMNLTDDQMWNANGKWMKEVITASGINFIRWGYGAWNWDWVKETPLCFDMWARYNSHDALGSFGLKECIAFCKETGIVPILMVPVTIHQYPQTSWAQILTMVDSMANYVESQGLQNVYFELGNEPGFKITETDYISRLKDFYPRVKAVNSLFKVTASMTDFTESTVKTGAAGFFDAIDHHYYATLNYWAGFTSKTNDNFFDPASQTGGIEEILGECNVLWPDWNGIMARDFQSSLPLLNGFLNVIKLNRASYVSSWPSHWPKTSNGESYGLFDYNSWSDYALTNIYSGPILAHSIVNKNVLDRIPTVSGVTTSLRVFAFSDNSGEKLNVILINKSNTSQIVNINLGSVLGYLNSFIFKGTSLTDLAPTYKVYKIHQKSIAASVYNDTIPAECAVVFNFYNDNSSSIPGAFNLVSPVNADTDVSTLKCFKWRRSINAVNYSIVVSTQSDFTNPIINKSIGNDTSYQDLSVRFDYSKKYYWKVTAYNKNGFRNCSETNTSFTTALQPILSVFTAQIKNGDFENYEGWDSWNDYVKLTSVSTNVFAGNYSGELSTSETGFNQYIRGLQIGKDYELSIYAKNQSVIDSMYFVIDFFNSGEQKISSKSIIPQRKTVFQKSSFTFTVPENTFRANIWVWKPISSGIILIDNITLTPLFSASDKIIFAKTSFLYPNPFTNYLTIEGFKDPTIQVLTLSGQLILSINQIKENQTLDLSQLPKGMYLLQLVEGDKISYQKIIKK